MPAKIVIAKLGMLGISPLLEGLVDERGVREDVLIRSVSSGCQMNLEAGQEIANSTVVLKPDIVFLVSPYIPGEGPQVALSTFSQNELPVCVLTNSYSQKVMDALIEQKIGYIISTADPMIGARKEFLDPTEMAIFNSDIIKVQAITGVYKIINEEIDRIINDINNKKAIQMPQLVIDKELAVNRSKFVNPYAYAKSIAAFEASTLVAKLSTRGCYVVKDTNQYIPLVAASHELMRIAAMLSDESRELEKKGDTVSREVHLSNGVQRRKARLFELFTP